MKTSGKFEHQTHQGGDEYSQQQRNDIGPGRKRNVLLDDDDEANNKADHKHSNVPPPWRFLVVLDHVGMMTIVISALLRTLVRSYKVTTPEQEAMGNQGSNLKGTQLVAPATAMPTTTTTWLLDGRNYGTHCSVGHEQSICECASQSGETVLSQSGLVKHTSGEDIGDGILQVQMLVARETVDTQALGDLATCHCAVGLPEGC